MHLTSFAPEPETTASIARPVSPLSNALDEEDWRRAQSALGLAVDPQGSGQAVNWDNPATRRRGSFAPAGLLVLVDNLVCRSFTALINDANAAIPETRHEGQACRTGPGEWVVREVKLVGRPGDHGAKIPMPLLQSVPAKSPPLLPSRPPSG